MNLPARSDVGTSPQRLCAGAQTYEAAVEPREVRCDDVPTRVLRQRQILARELPPPVWRYTDDTVMALAIHETLAAHERIEQDSLAATFAVRYRTDPQRGYGRGAHDILTAIGGGVSWRDASQSAFGGTGSRGNGGAMRVAPLGAYFADDVARCIREADASAEVTHAHPDGRAGTIAVAVASSWVAARAAGVPGGDEEKLLPYVLTHTPAGSTHDRLAEGVELDRAWRQKGTPPFASEEMARTLGNGSEVLASDTVPLALFAVARGLSFEETFWLTVGALGDRDTTCAIACGIVALRDPPPPHWVAARERLEW